MQLRLHSSGVLRSSPYLFQILEHSEQQSLLLTGRSRANHAQLRSLSGLFQNQEKLPEQPSLLE